jgi:hypothetical protein
MKDGTTSGNIIQSDKQNPDLFLHEPELTFAQGLVLTVLSYVRYLLVVGIGWLRNGHLDSLSCLPMKPRQHLMKQTTIGTGLFGWLS